jgi:hypothetical protein
MGMYMIGNNILGFSTNSVERIRINPLGHVGINNNAPAQPLDVGGNVRFSGALMPAGNAGNAGEILVSQGAGNPPVWSNVQYGNNAHSVTLNNMVTNTDQANWTNIPGMSLTFTPTHNVFYIFASFCARLTNNSSNAQFGQAIIQGRILVNGVEVAKAASIITDFDEDYWGGMYLVTSGTVAFAGVRANAVVGNSTTVVRQWRPVVLWADSPWRVEINPALSMDHCVLTVFD